MTLKQWWWSCRQQWSCCCCCQPRLKHRIVHQSFGDFFDDSSTPPRYGSVEHLMPDGRFALDASSFDINFSLDAPANHAITSQPNKNDTYNDNHVITKKSSKKSFKNVFGKNHSNENFSNNGYNNTQGSGDIPIFQIRDSKRLEVRPQDVEMLQHLGHGWFGSVMEARIRRTKGSMLTFENVIALCLRKEANQQEKTRFQEMMRASKTDNECLLGLVAECGPDVALLEVCAMGDLKHFLTSRRDQLQVLLEEGLLLKFCVQITRGVGALHAMDAVPTDLALRTCQLTANLDVKVGDYGLAPTRYLDDYVPIKGEYFPVRWMPPEILSLLHNLGEDEELVFNWSSSHGIWALAITLYEVISGASRPFDSIADSNFVQQAVQKPQMLRDAIGPLAMRGTDMEAVGSVIDLCLKLDPRARPACARLERYLSDFYEVTVEDVRQRERFGSHGSSFATDDSVFEKSTF